MRDIERVQKWLDMLGIKFDLDITNPPVGGTLGQFNLIDTKSKIKVITPGSRTVCSVIKRPEGDKLWNKYECNTFTEFKKIVKEV